MKHFVGLSVVLCVLWLVLSGHFEPLMLSFGAISVALTLILSKRMQIIDGQGHPLHFLLQLPVFWIKLQFEIFVANIDVIGRIIGLKPMSPTLVKIPLPSDDDLINTIYCNAITLTPGTASLFIEENHLIVHCVSEQGAQSLVQGDMQKLLAHLEHDLKEEVAHG